MTRFSQEAADTLPCRHQLPADKIQDVKHVLQNLPSIAPRLLEDLAIHPDDYEMLLRAAVESLRGTASASTRSKANFIGAVLEFGAQQKTFSGWESIGTKGRSDYRVELPDGTTVCIEAKGCPDGNNTTIWDRPGWADEFIVWCLCPESLAHPPGNGVWSGIATRLLPKIAVEKEVVDAMIFWDGRCGSRLRPCPKQYGVVGLRGKATSIPSQPGTNDWVPPPCIYLLPRTWPNISNNPKPKIHTLGTCRFADAMLDLFQVPPEDRNGYVHQAGIEARGTLTGIDIAISVTSRCWKDGEDRCVARDWKRLKRE